MFLKVVSALCFVFVNAANDVIHVHFRQDSKLTSEEQVNYVQTALLDIDIERVEFAKQFTEYPTVKIFTNDEAPDDTPT